MEESFESAYPDLFREIYRVAYGVLGDRQAAEDVVQETLVRAYLRWRRIREFHTAWARRVAVNLSIDVLRRSVRSADRGTAVLPDHVAERLDLQEALLNLSKRQREVVVLRYWLGHTEQEVSDLLGCSIGTVKTHAHRGLASLRATLGEHYEESALHRP